MNMRHFTMTLIYQIKVWEEILPKQFLNKVNADSGEMDLSSIESDSQDNDHLGSYWRVKSWVLFAIACQILDQLQGFPFSFDETEIYFL